MAEEDKKSTCGIVMPISAIDGCSEAHWAEVRTILFDVIEEAGFEPNMVSDADDVGVIQKRIIQNLYDNPVVVCDVSAKNPNVMFELGMRLAFDKPTIIVKDDVTSYSFDTSSIEHLEYPRDLRFGKIVDFKAKLSDKIVKTHEKATTDSTYTTFLKHFGEFKVAKIDKKEVSGQEFIIDELKSLRQAIGRLDGAGRMSGPPPHLSVLNDIITVRLDDVSQADMSAVLALLDHEPDSWAYEVFDVGGHRYLQAYAPEARTRKRLRNMLRSVLPPSAFFTPDIRSVRNIRPRVSGDDPDSLILSA
jgi:hypothetical protein